MNIHGAEHYTLLYFFVFLISFLFSAFQEMNSSKKKAYLLITLGLLAFMNMFRGSNIGNDTDDYIAMFNRISNSDVMHYIKNTDTEPGYILYDWIVAKLFHHYQYTFICSGIFIYISLFRFIIKWVNSPGMFLCMFVGMNTFDFFLSNQRQAISVALILFAFDFCYKRKFAPFLLIMCIAISFHYSSIIFLLMYPLLKIDKYDKKKFTTIIVITGLSILFFNKLLNLMLSFFPKYRYYEGGASFDGNPRLALFLQFALRLFVIIVSDMLIDNENKQKKEDVVMKLLSYIGLSITAVSMQATALQRFCETFNPYLLSRFSNTFGYSYSRDRSIVLMVSLLVFYLYGLIIVLFKTPEWITIYPFSFSFP